MAEVYRLAPQVYEQLEQKLPKPVIGQGASDQHTGYLLGIQYVLAILREGFTIGDNTPQGASSTGAPRSLRRGG